MNKIIWKVIKIAGLSYLGSQVFVAIKGQALIRMLDGWLTAYGGKTYTDYLMEQQSFGDIMDSLANLMAVLVHHKFNVDKAFEYIITDHEEES